MTTIDTLTLDHLTLNVNEKIHVSAPLERTFATLLDQMGPHNETPYGKAADDHRAVAGRPLVPRPRRQQRPLLGRCPGHQAAHAARDQRTAVHVAAGHVEHAVPARSKWTVGR